jgi:hypothetical protein
MFHQSIPEYFEFKNSAYTDGETFIKSDTRVRMRLQGVKYEPTGIVRFDLDVFKTVIFCVRPCLFVKIAVATINEDYLGPVASSGLLE